MPTLSGWKKWRNPSRWIWVRLDDRLLLIALGAVVGVCSGLAAVALNRALLSMASGPQRLAHGWWMFLLPAIGAFLASVFLEKIMREGGGHGVPEVVYSVSRHGGPLRSRPDQGAFIRQHHGDRSIGLARFAADRGTELPGHHLTGNQARSTWISSILRLITVLAVFSNWGVMSDT